MKDVKEVVGLDTPVPGRNEVLLVNNGRKEVSGMFTVDVLLVVVVILEVVAVDERLDDALDE